MARMCLPRGIRTAALVLAGCTALVLGVQPAAADVLEYAVKATYLYKFAPFVEWPPTAFETETSPLSLCVAGQDPFGDTLDRAVRGQLLGERPIAVRRMHEVAVRDGCHILFAGGSPRQPVEAALDAVRGAPVLTVTDGGATPQARGIVNFVMLDGRVRFEMDDQSAAENGLSLSSKLLSLAVSVRRRS
jgi:hypothetical protein